MSWKPEFLVGSNWSRNALVFATKEEAESNARDLFMRWTMPSKWRVVEVDEEVNYGYDDHELIPVKLVASIPFDEEEGEDDILPR